MPESGHEPSYDSNVLYLSNKWTVVHKLQNINHVKQVVCHNSEFIAIDFRGNLLLGDNILRLFAKNKFIQEIVKGTELLFVTNRGVYVRKEHQFSLLYRGLVERIFTGVSHVFYKTKEGYRSRGSNNRYQRGIENVYPLLAAITGFSPITTGLINAPSHINDLPVANIYLGGYCTFVKLENGTFMGFGANTRGELGFPSEIDVRKPTLLNLHEFGIDEIFPGAHCSFGRTSAGAFFFWGFSRRNFGAWTDEPALSTPTLLAVNFKITRLFTDANSDVAVFQSDDRELYALVSQHLYATHF
jgi:alpha-tubulin suppressor-like RCC1 family protein